MIKGIETTQAESATTSAKQARAEEEEEELRCAKIKQQKLLAAHEAVKKAEAEAAVAATTGFGLVGGYTQAVATLRELVFLPLLHPQLFRRIGAAPPFGLMLTGPSGMGKTLLARCAAEDAGVEVIELAVCDVSGQGAGEAEQELRKAFQKAKSAAPAVLFIDNIDTLAPARYDASGSGEKTSSTSTRVVSQLISLLDDATRLRDTERIVIIAASARPGDIDPSVRRAGRLDNEIVLSLPVEHEREDILRVHCRGMHLSDDVDLPRLAAEHTLGYNGADLAALCGEAGVRAATEAAMELGVVDDIDRVEMDDESMAARVADVYVTHRHFISASVHLGPSSLRETQIETPDVPWAAVGGLQELQARLQRMVVWPRKHHDVHSHFGLQPSRGLLLYGPPGCGKTLIAKAVATECGANFMSVAAADLLDKHMGDSEANVRMYFERARAARPCVLFLDELDAIASSRSKGGDSDGMADGVVSALAAEMDAARRCDALSLTGAGVIMIGATNRPQVIDSALLRPGRFDELLHVRLPDEAMRGSVLKAALRNTPLAEGVGDKLHHLAAATAGFSGADLMGIVKRAVQVAVHESIEASTGEDTEPEKLGLHHLEAAMGDASLRRSVSDEQAAHFDAIEAAIKDGRAMPTFKSATGDVAEDEQEENDMTEADTTASIATLQGELRMAIAELQALDATQKLQQSAQAKADNLATQRGVRQEWQTKVQEAKLDAELVLGPLPTEGSLLSSFKAAREPCPAFLTCSRSIRGCFKSLLVMSVDTLGLWGRYR